MTSNGQAFALSRSRALTSRLRESWVGLGLHSPGHAFKVFGQGLEEMGPVPDQLVFWAFSGGWAGWSHLR